MHIPIVTGFYAGILGLILVFLIARVGRVRGRAGISLQDGGNRELGVAIRQHGNFIEMVPMCLILIGIVEMGQFSIYIVHILGVVLVISRLIHPFGLNFENGATWQRAVGAGGTTMVLAIASILTIYLFFVRMTAGI